MDAENASVQVRDGKVPYVGPVNVGPYIGNAGHVLGVGIPIRVGDYVRPEAPYEGSISVL